MNNDQFDVIAKEGLSMQKTEPSERVWQRIQKRKQTWLPAPREMMIAWVASAAVLLVAWSATSNKRLPNQDQEPPIQIAAIDDPTYTVAAVTRVAVPASIPIKQLR